MSNHTEAAEQYIQNRLGGVVNADNINYDEVNLTPYSQLQDNDNAGPFDRQSKLFTNADGEAYLIRSQGVDRNNIDQVPQWYDFDKKEFTDAGKIFYTRQMENPSEEDKNAYLTQVENELKSALIADYNRRRKTDPNAKPNSLLNLSSMGKIESGGDKQNASFEFPEFGKVDRILQQLSLRNLKYPIDADYGNTQDYIQINQFTYKPPSGNIFFPEGGMSEGFSQAVDSLTQGVPSGTPKEKAIGLVKLPMPNSLADSNNVSWGPDQLNALTAAAVAASMGTSGDTVTAIRNFANTMGQRTPMENVTEGLGKVGDGIGNLLNQLGVSMGDFNDADKKNINLLGRTVIGSQLLNLLQFQVSPESILSRGAGVIPNSNLALLFNAPTLREFTFSWKMSPRSREEATRVNNILRFFKQGMAPKKASDTKSGGGSFFLGTPNIFDIHFKTAKTKDYQILDRNDSVLRIKTCACTGAAVNYTPEGMWNAYEQGQPVAITLTLRFNELEPIFDTDYDNNYFNYDPSRTDLLPVPTDAVGY